MTNLRDLLRDLQADTLRKAKESGLLPVNYDIQEHISDEIYAEQLDDYIQAIQERIIG